MTDDLLSGAVWNKSSYSGGNDNCVEVADLPGGRKGVRDSKNPNGPTLVFTAGEWTAFLNGVHAGEFGES
ncbi:DUF397 domain-containing protein [Nocardia goodfellowii]